MKTGLLLKVFISILIISCNNKSEKNKKIKTNEVSIQQTEELKTEYTLRKNKDNPTYLIYEVEEGDFRFTYYTKSAITYGVLEKYSNETDRSDYYIFEKQENLHQQFTINLKNALFTKRSNELNPNYSDYTEVNLLLKNYIIIGFRCGSGYPDYAIIDVNKQTVSNFNTHGSFEVSEDEKFLIGWKDSKKKISVETICPEHKDMIDYYVVTEEFKYNLATGQEISTGKLGCGFVQ